MVQGYIRKRQDRNINGLSHICRAVLDRKGVKMVWILPYGDLDKWDNHFQLGG